MSQEQIGNHVMLVCNRRDNGDLVKTWQRLTLGIMETTDYVAIMLVPAIICLSLAIIFILFGQ